MSKTGGDWTIACAHEQMVAAHDRSLLVLSWRTGAGAEHVQEVGALQRRLVEQGHVPLSVLHIFSLEPKLGIGDGLRNDAQKLFEKMARYYFAQAYVVLGEGFWAASIRAFLAAFTGLMTRRVKTRTFGSIEDGMVWLSELEGQPAWLQQQPRERAQQIEDVILSAHYPVNAGIPELRTFAPTKPQPVIELDVGPIRVGPWTATCGALHVSHWTASTSTADVVRMHHEINGLMREEGGSVMLLMFVAPGTPLSSAEARTRAATMLRELNESIAGVAVVVSGSGLWSMALGGMCRGVALATHNPINWQIFDQVATAVDWLAEQAGSQGLRIPGIDEVEQVVESLQYPAG